MSQLTLTGSNLEEQSIEILRRYEPGGGYKVAFSGGKDSIVILHLCKLAGVKHSAFYCKTTIDPKGVPQFIRTNYPEVEMVTAKYKKQHANFYQLVALKGLPKRHIRWCCSVFKETGGKKGDTLVFGVRRSESRKRAGRGYVGEYNGRKHVNPILDWSDRDVWEFIHKYQLPYPDLYDSGHKRLGCTMCPLSCRKARIRDYLEYPERVRALEKAMDQFMETHPKSKLTHKNGHDAVYAWVYESPIESAKGTCMQPIVNEDE